VRNIKPPPILSKKIEVTKESFPLKVSIDYEKDITPEGKELYREWTSGYYYYHRFIMITINIIIIITSTVYYY
jgi:hypothetical protein